MRRAMTPWIVLAVFGLVAGGAYRYFADDASEATLANYLRSGLHGMGLTLSAWAVHLYFTSRSSEWVRRWPLVIEIVVQSAVMAIVVATVAIGLEVVLYGHGIEAAWLAAGFPRIVGLTFCRVRCDRRALRTDTPHRRPGALQCNYRTVSKANARAARAAVPRHRRIDVAGGIDG